MPSTKNGESLETYLKEIDKTPLLSPLKEKQLTAQLRTTYEILHLLASQMHRELHEIMDENEIAELSKIFDPDNPNARANTVTNENLYNPQIYDRSDIVLEEFAHAPEYIQKKVQSGLHAILESTKDWAGEEDLELFRSSTCVYSMVNEGLQARDSLIASNLRLVVSIAKKYPSTKVPISDRIEEGNLGLIRGIEGFDYRRGQRVTTYVSYWIKQSIKQALKNQQGAVRIPMYMHEVLAMCNTMRAYLTPELQKHFGEDRFPTEAELAQAAGITEKRYKKICAARKAVSSGNQGPIAPLYDEDDYDPFFGANATSTDPFTKVMQADELAVLSEYLDLLDEREMDVIASRFGLNNKKAETLKAIGERLGMTRERVRQIEKEAIQTMQLHARQRGSYEGPEEGYPKKPKGKPHKKNGVHYTNDANMLSIFAEAKQHFDKGRELQKRKEG